MQCCVLLLCTGGAGECRVVCCCCVQEVLVNAILVPSIHRVSSPDFINETITWPVSD